MRLQWLLTESQLEGSAPGLGEEQKTAASGQIEHMGAPPQIVSRATADVDLEIFIGGCNLNAIADPLWGGFLRYGECHGAVSVRACGRQDKELLSQWPITELEGCAKNSLAGLGRHELFEKVRVEEGSHLLLGGR
jgi:hypothetical protein